jgi:SAM-dependent methyltransferase
VHSPPAGATPSDEDPRLWVRSALRLYGLLARSPGMKRVLDLGCGTGRCSELLARQGWSVTGVDKSPEMLAWAADRLVGVEPAPLLVCQDLRQLELGQRRFELVVALRDTLNYLQSKEELVAALTGVIQYLAPGGVLAFDLGTAHRLATRYGDRTWVEEREDSLLVCDSRWYPRQRLCHMRVNLFRRAQVAGDKELWERTTEVHLQRAHSDTEVADALRQSGFTQILGPLAAFCLLPASPDTERVFFAAVRGR